MGIKLDKQFVTKDYRPSVYKKVIGRSGRIWIYAETEGAAGYIHCSADPVENELGYRGFRGYGGSTLTFPLEDGTVEKLQGPWHSNSDAFFEDTGIDIRNKHITFVIISREREMEGLCTIMKEVVYVDPEPLEGKFERGTELAMALAKDFGDTLFCYSEGCGGSSCSPVYPDQVDVHGRRANNEMY